MSGSLIGIKSWDKLKYRISLFAADYSRRLTLVAEIVIKIILDRVVKWRYVEKIL